MRWPSHVVFAFVFGGVAACSSTTEDRLSRIEEKGGTPAPDGASGYCCPASMGGCAFSGGYRESEACPQKEDLCDNMCEQRIVKDEHGCEKLSYVPCTSIATDDGSSTDGGSTVSEPADGGSGDANADEGCPPLDVLETLEGTSCDRTRKLPENGCSLCSPDVECCRHFLVCVDDVVDTWKVLEAGPCP